jgi:K+-transporting ATPase ATPase C chain
MLGILIAALRASLVTWVICGLVYPIAVNGLAQWLLPFQANGSLVRAPDGTVVGSVLIGQQWNGPEWFHGRPSATSDSPYNAASSGGSNLAPTSKALAARLAADRTALEAVQTGLAGRALPADMLTASGSGLDPDISPGNAAVQVPRVAAARGVPPAQIAALVRQHTSGRDLGLFGEPRVNVLELNRELMRIHPDPAARN